MSDAIKVWIFNKLFAGTRMWAVRGSDVSRIMIIKGMRLPNSIVKKGRFCLDYEYKEVL